MNDVGFTLVAAGLALLLVPLAELLGSLGYFLFGGALLVTGSYLVTRSDSIVSTGDPATVNCPNCGSPNDPDDGECGYCGEAL